MLLVIDCTEYKDSYFYEQECKPLRCEIMVSSLLRITGVIGNFVSLAWES